MGRKKEEEQYTSLLVREREHVCMSELERSRIQREGQDRKKKDGMY